MGVAFTSSFVPTGSKNLNDLVHAIECADLSMVRAALAAGADPNARIEMIGGQFFANKLSKNLTPMRYACVIGLPSTLWSGLLKELALSGGVPGSCAHLESALSTACQYKDAKTVELALAWGAAPNGMALHGVSTPLIQALDAGSFDCAELLVKAGADVDYLPADHRHEGKLCSRGLTPLVHICKNPNEKNRVNQKVEFLIEHGANPDLGMRFVGCPLEFAAERHGGNIEECLSLLAAGANPWAKGKGGSSINEKLRALHERSKLGGESASKLDALDVALAAKKKRAPRYK